MAYSFPKSKKTFPEVVLRHVQNEHVIPHFRNMDGTKFDPNGTATFFLNCDCEHGLAKRLAEYGYPVQERALDKNSPDILTSCIKLSIKFDDPYNPSKVYIMRKNAEGRYEGVPATKGDCSELNSMNIKECHMVLRAYERKMNPGVTAVCQSLWVLPDEENPVMPRPGFEDPFLKEFSVIEDDEPDSLPFH